jgi:hypothetical protein
MATREFPWEDIITEIPLAEAANVAPRVIAGATRGRVVVALGS